MTSVIHQFVHRITGGPGVVCPFCFEQFKLDESVEHQPKCPKCGRTIPINAVDYRAGLRPRIIGLLGAKEAGKTHFIGSMLECLRRSGINFNWALTGLGDSIERFRVEFFEPIFVERRPVPLSLKGAGKKPLSFKLSIQAPEGKLNVIFLTFFDTAGESFASEEMIEQESDYVCSSDGLILLLDPLQLPGVRRALQGKVELPNKQLDTEDIVQRTANILRRRKKIRAQNRIKTPIAITFSKLDLLLGLCPASSPLGHESKHAGVFSQSEFDDIDGEIRAHLHEWEGASLITQVAHNFRTSGFFGISALGCNPENGKLPALAPKRVLDPLIWHLHLHKLLKTVK